MTRGERQLREAIIAKCRWMNDSGLNQASLNISVRYEDRMRMTAKRFASDRQRDSAAAATARTPVAPRGTEKGLSRAK
jgi:L-fuculose-phosphate aldolase